MEILFLPQLEVSECALMLICRPLWGGGRRWREAGEPTGPGLLRTVAALHLSFPVHRPHGREDCPGVLT